MQVHRDIESRRYTTGYENRSSSDLKCGQDIEDIQGHEYWKDIAHTILRVGIIRALNESAGRLF